MTDKNFVNYANSFQAIARLELQSIKLLLDYLDHPEKDLKFIHVAGTNGKGSVCAFLQEIFTHSGYRTGKYISPNMISVCERISVDGEEIEEKELEEILNRVQNASKKVQKELGGMPTQFEIWTAAAFCYFKEKECDMVILETGLGGMRDATNVIGAPSASVITRIALDHVEYLGNTLSEVASQKAGIIKKHPDGEWGITVTTDQDADVIKELEKVCDEKKNKLFVTSTPKIHSPKGICEVFSYGEYENVVCNIPGLHQVENACIAIETAKRLKISREHIIYGIENAKNIGRFELIKDEPRVLFDGAHNPNGMKSLMVGLKRYFPDIVPVFIMASMADKDISGVLEEIRENYENPDIFTVAVEDNPRSATADMLAEKIKSAGLFAEPCKTIKLALDRAEKKGELIVICGSLYLYKDLKSIE